MMHRLSLNGLLSIPEGEFELPAIRAWALMTATQVPETKIGEPSTAC